MCAYSLDHITQNTLWAACSLAVFLLCSQLVCTPVRPKADRVMRHVQMRHFEMYPRNSGPTQNVKNFFQIVKEQFETKVAPRARFDSIKLLSSATRRVIPTRFNRTSILNEFAMPKVVVEPGGIEPPTSCVQSRRSPS